MLASQLIYTGCGKDKTGAFSVWSKSLDITKVEENEIRDKMIYKRPSNLPFEPTPEEIENLFPKKFGYFFLSSGRACLAQSVYIGNVYSDLDHRTGNYIIHAFVFDKCADIIPMNFIGSDIFKKGLTYEEWHDQDAPEDLPKIEIDDRPAPLTKQDIDLFFDDQRTERLKLLVQAIINASADDRKVTFYDKHSNLKYWYKAISACLPKGIQSDITLNTFFTPSTPLPSQMQAAAALTNTEIKIRNIAPTVSATLFNYQQDARAGKYAFEFEAGILPANLTVTNYVSNIVDTLKINVFNAIMLVDAVGKVAAKCGTDLDTAMDIHLLLTKQIAKIDDIAKLSELIKYAEQYYRDNLSDIADCLYEYGLSSGRWTLSSAISSIYRFVFDYSDAADKSEMIHSYVAEQRAFGVDIGVGANEYCDTFKNNAPFAWINFLDYLFDASNMSRYFSVNGESFNSRYLIFNTFVESVQEYNDVAEQKTTALKYLADTAKHYVKQEKLDELTALVKCCGKLSARSQSWLIDKAFLQTCKDGKRLSDLCSMTFTLSVAEACPDVAASAELVKQLVTENIQNSTFIKLYVERYDRNTSFYSSVAGALSADSKLSQFVKNVDLYRFEIATHVTKAQMQDYYDNYFAAGKDNGLFANKLRIYLSEFCGKDCIIECLRCYEYWMKEKNIDRSDLNSCMEIICNALFDCDKEALRDYIKVKGIEKTKEMIALAPEGYRATNKYYYIAFGEHINKVISEIDSKKNPAYAQTVLEKLEKEEFYRIPKDDRTKDEFVYDYMPKMFELFLALADDTNFETVYYGVFKLFYSCASFDRRFCEELGKLKDREYDKFLSYTIMCAACKKNQFNAYLAGRAERVLDELGGGKRKKLFAQLLDKVPAPYEAAVADFIKQYQKAHEGLLGKLFGGFGKGAESAKEDKKADKKEAKRDERRGLRKEQKDADKASDVKEKRKWKE